jgi:hypothetical protein
MGRRLTRDILGAVSLISVTTGQRQDQYRQQQQQKSSLPNVYSSFVIVQKITSLDVFMVLSY